MLLLILFLKLLLVAVVWLAGSTITAALWLFLRDAVE